MKKALAFIILAACASVILYWMFQVVPTAEKPSSTPILTNEAPNAQSPSEQPGITQSSLNFEDPRLTFDSPFRNIRPDIKYLGDASCLDCHQALCTTFHQHPMGRSAILAGADKLENLAPEAMNPCQVGPYELSVRIENGQMIHSLTAQTSDGEKLPKTDLPVTVAIGSGTRGRSYLTYDGDAVWQSPVSWFSTNGRWDVSPGFDLGGATQRPTISNCLFCHVQEHKALDNAINRYELPLSPTQLSIGCERCHGPGELHVKERTEGLEKSIANKIAETQSKEAIDTSIVNPKHLSTDLQLSICAQCHLAGKARVVRQNREESEFRPGMPLELFVNAYVAHPDAKFKNKAVGHFDQMLQSQCRLPDGTKLLCTTCHDPHEKFAPEEAERKYLQDCKSCHQDRQCSAPSELREKQQDHCIRCHMPTNSNTNIAHTSLTDHRILRDPTISIAVSNDLADVPVLVPYFQSELLSPEERGRNLAIALSKFSEKMPATLPIKQRSVTTSKELLSKSLEIWKNDTDGWLALSSLEMGAGNSQGAIQALQSAMRANPKDENVLSLLAFMAESSGRLELALGALNDLIAANPSSQDYRLKRMVMYVSGGDFVQAEAECRELLRINPLQPTARLVLGMCLYGAGEKKAGRKEIDIALNLATSPQQRDAIQGWFDRFVAWQAKSQ